MKMIHKVWSVLADFPPQGYEEFCEVVIQKVHHLIRSGIWDRPSIDDFDNWRRNFQGDVGRYISAYLADKFIFYSEEDVKSLLAWAYDDALRRLVLMNWTPDLSRNPSELDAEWSDLYDTTKRSVLVCPAVADTTAASGFPMIRYLRDSGRLQEGQTCFPADVNARLKSGGYKALILVDDLLGTGTQVDQYWHGTSKGFPQGQIPFQRSIEEYAVPTFLTVVAATEEGLTHLQKAVPGLSVVAAEILTAQWNMQNPEFWRTDEAGPALEYLRELVKQAGIRLFGFKGGTWSVAFHHGTPNNCSPVYWHRSKTWHPMVPNREEG